MEDQELRQKLEALEKKVDAVVQSVEKIRTYFLWALVVSMAMFVLPLIGLLFVAPAVLSMYGSLEGL